LPKRHDAAGVPTEQKENRKLDFGNLITRQDSREKTGGFTVSASARPNFEVATLPVAETTSNKIAELVRVQKFAQRITSSLDLDEVVQRVADEVAASLGCVEINIYLHDSANSELVLTGMRGCSTHGKGHRMKIGTEGMVGHVAATRKMHYAPNVLSDPYYSAC
jgi:hypothetical protein